MQRKQPTIGAVIGRANAPASTGSNFRFNSTNAALTNPKMTSVRRDVALGKTFQWKGERENQYSGDNQQGRI